MPQPKKYNSIHSYRLHMHRVSLMTCSVITNWDTQFRATLYMPRTECKKTVRQYKLQLHIKKVLDFAEL